MDTINSIYNNNSSTIYSLLSLDMIAIVFFPYGQIMQHAAFFFLMTMVFIACMFFVLVGTVIKIPIKEEEEHQEYTRVHPDDHAEIQSRISFRSYWW